MTQLLDEAFRRARELADAEQDAIGALVLAELEDEQVWDDAFQAGLDTLGQLAARARLQHLRGETAPMTSGNE